MEITRDEVLSRLQGIFDELFLDEVVLTPELNAGDVEEWDSLIHISLVVTVEERFGIRFRMGEVEAAKNISDFVDIILNQLAGKYA